MHDASSEFPYPTGFGTKMSGNYTPCRTKSQSSTKKLVLVTPHRTDTGWEAASDNLAFWQRYTVSLIWPFQRTNNGVRSGLRCVSTLCLGARPCGRDIAPIASPTSDSLPLLRGFYLCAEAACQISATSSAVLSGRSVRVATSCHIFSSVRMPFQPGLAPKRLIWPISGGIPANA